jgi:peptidoglycan/xylan/chitin deacetylase (PgdA/CDA1 family)
MNYAARLGDGHIAIFLFHGVTLPVHCAVRNYTRKHVERDYFVSVIRRLKQVGTPISMEQVRRHYEVGEPLPPGPFGVTFDDGFQNNLTLAAPVLVDEKVPATFYVTTSFVENNYMSWIDRIEYAIEHRSKGKVRFPWGERQFKGDKQRRVLLSEIRHEVKNDLGIDSDSLATDIQQQLGVAVTYSSAHPLDRKLSWDEVTRLAKEPLFTVAGHGHTHRILESLEDEELGFELDTSLHLLEKKAGIRSVHYSYPEGLLHCYSDRVIRALKLRGIRCCPSAEDGINNSEADLFHLKRIMVA